MMMVITSARKRNERHPRRFLFLFCVLIERHNVISAITVSHPSQNITKFAIRDGSRRLCIFVEVPLSDFSGMTHSDTTVPSPDSVLAIILKPMATLSTKQ